jgi:hypothetical protein
VSLKQRRCSGARFRREEDQKEAIAVGGRRSIEVRAAPAEEGQGKQRSFGLGRAGAAALSQGGPRADLDAAGPVAWQMAKRTGGRLTAGGCGADEGEASHEEEDDAPQGAERRTGRRLGLVPGCGVEEGRRAGDLGSQRRSGCAGARQMHEAEVVRGRDRARENWGARPAVHGESSRVLEGRRSRVWKKSSAQGEG